MISAHRLSAVLAAAAGVCTIASSTASAAPISRSWVGGTSNVWGLAANWSPTGAPNGTDFTAIFNQTPATYQPAVTVSVTVAAGLWMTGATVGDIEFTSVGAVTMQTDGKLQDNPGVGVLVDNTSSGALTINTTSFKLGAAQSWINNSANLLTIAAPANLNALALTVSGTGNTLMSGGITSTAGSVTKTGAGTLTISGASNLYTGSTTVNNGALLVTGTLGSSGTAVTANGGRLGGTGAINRPVTINASATLAPGISSLTAGTLTIDRALTLAGTAEFDIVAPGVADRVSVNPTNASSPARPFTFGGTLDVNATGVAFAAGQTYDLFDWGANSTPTGKFATISLPALSGGLSWEMFGDQPFNYANGQISVVPEPMGMTMLGLVGAGMVLSRRRARGKA